MGTIRLGIAPMQHRTRNLPHFEGAGRTYFLTFRRHSKVHFDLTDPLCGEIIVSALHFFHGDRYLLYDYTIMPDHVHMIIKPLKTRAKTNCLSKILHSIKSWTANQINCHRGARGPVWQEETYDHIIRDRQDYETKSRYIWANPVRAGLTDDPTDWPWWGHGLQTGE